jgi:hypothetical protein
MHLRISFRFWRAITMQPLLSGSAQCAKSARIDATLDPIPRIAHLPNSFIVRVIGRYSITWIGSPAKVETDDLAGAVDAMVEHIKNGWREIDFETIGSEKPMAAKLRSAV